jgi:hypothetical protein
MALGGFYPHSEAGAGHHPRQLKLKEVLIMSIKQID